MSNSEHFRRPLNGSSRPEEGRKAIHPLYTARSRHDVDVMWGRRVAEFANPLPHVELTVVYVPEGMRLLARCERCGGRQESLLDLRASLSTPEVPALTAKFAVRAKDVMALMLELWLPEHAGCHETPRQHHLPSEVGKLIDRRLTRAAKQLTRGRQVPTVIYLLLENGTVLELPMDDLPACTSERDRSDRVTEVSLRHFMVREWQRRRGIEARAAVMVGEAWVVEVDIDDKASSELARYPSRAPTRREVMQVAVVTSSMCLAGMSEIRRQGGRMGEGRGTFTRPDVSMPVGSSLLLDGLLATGIE